MVDTSLDISAADDLKTRSSAKAGLDAGLGADEGVAEEEAFAVEEDAAPGVLLMDFIAPVVGMERAMAKNSSVRSIMVKVICIDVWFSQSCSAILVVSSSVVSWLFIDFFRAVQVLCVLILKNNRGIACTLAELLLVRYCFVM